ncbi:type IVB pilus formation outer membrane protein, R64 PilN family [Vibrio xiamenensis]|uniref:Type IVB pilus formation outer membrane protein, R64 PilN family n=1 Tax=Vibrio xiamenensis TaxID=861298 RepID=A0A1G8FFP3_9VIBR|nr:hypothetical protein [Vibrio xiamenensis]SDH80940.1 type IVB pilus formation outer membrane protein, R64 PilN family [Vibrio xiamenensis]
MENKKLLKYLTLSIAAASISGCGWNGYLQHEERTELQKAEIDRISALMMSTDGAMFVDEPPLLFKPKEVDNRPAWLIRPNINLNMGSSKLPLSQLMADLRSFVNIHPIYGDVDHNTPIHVNAENASLVDVLDSISAQLDIAYKIDDKQVIWSKYDSQIFPLETLIGDMKFGMGSSSGDSEVELTDGDSGDSDTSDSITSLLEDYAMISGESLEHLTSIEKSIGQIISGDVNASVIASKASASLVVRARPSALKQVRNYVEAENKSLTKQALLMVKIISFESYHSNGSGINWDLVKSATQGSINMTSSGGVSVTDGSYFRFAPTFGGLDGSAVLVNALEQQGKVSVSNSIPVTAMNNRPTRFQYIDSVGYVSNVETETDADTDITTQSLEKGVAESGYSMYTLSRILDDKIILQISSELSNLTDFETTTVQGIQTKTPEYAKSIFSQPNVIKNGETLVVNAYQYKKSSAGDEKNFGNKWFGNNSGETKTVDTIVLITPTIL